MLATFSTWVRSAARPFSRANYDARAHERLRFQTFLGLVVFQLIVYFGTAWDIQWHVSIGRDTFWIPPHMVAAAGFMASLSLALAAISYETWLDRQGARLPGATRVGGITVALPFLTVALGHLAIVFFAFIDDQWHRYFGLDATLWSPPHLAMALGLRAIDISILLGLAASAGRLGLKLHWRSAYFWSFVLLSALNFEALTAWSSEAFIFGYHYGGAGLLGLLFPIIAGTIYPLAIVLSLRLAQRYWIVVPILVLTLILQYAGAGFSALGFAILKPVSLIEEYVRQNPQSTVALTREFGRANGFPGLLGLWQAWVMWLSCVPLLLVALLDRWPAARGRWLLAAPVYSVSLVVTAYLWFQTMPGMSKYEVTWVHVALAVALATVGGLIGGWCGWRLAGLVVKDDSG